MTTRGCMLVGYCKARRPTLKTADFADNVLVGHLVSNQTVTAGQTSSLSPPLCGAFLGQGHILVTAGRPYGESGTQRWVGCCLSLPGVGAGLDAVHPPGAAASPGYHSGDCPRLVSPKDRCPAMDRRRPHPSASSPQAPCPSHRDSPPHGFLLICLCNELGVCNEPGRVISKRRLVSASPAGLCRCRCWCRCRGREGTGGSRGAAGGWRIGCRGQGGGQWGLFSQQCLSPHTVQPPPTLISLPGRAAPSPVALSPA